MPKIVELSAKNVDLTPPKYWGPLPWTMPDGMNAEKAQLIMRVFVEYTHSLGALCGEMNIPKATAEIYLANACQIPKSVAWKLPRLNEIMMKSPEKARLCFQAAKRKKASDYHQPEGQEPAMVRFKDINTEATQATARQFAIVRKTMKLSAAQVAEKIGTRTEVVTKAEKYGFSPYAGVFFALCEFYNVEPEGFVGDAGRKVEKWLKKRKKKG